MAHEPVNNIPVPPSGPKNADIMIVGEAPAKAEVDKMVPFVGGAGQELNDWLEIAGLSRNHVRVTNVLPWRSPTNKVADLCYKKKEVDQQYQDWKETLREQYPAFPWPDKYTWPHIGTAGAYLPPRFLYRLPELADEIRETDPNIIIPMGNLACWAVLGQTGITKIRGTVAESSLPPGYKVIPMTHPAAILRNYEERPICLMHMMKVAEQADDPTISRPERHILIDPTLEDIEDFYHTYFKQATYSGVDIETIPDQQLISIVGFSADENHALVIPFTDTRQENGSYWQSEEEEIRAWEWVKVMCQDAAVAKVLQNGLYDIFWLYEQLGITLQGNIHDTLILSRALQPELPADLGTLGSMFTNEPAWKLMRKGKTNKELE